MFLFIGILLSMGGAGLVEVSLNNTELLMGACVAILGALTILVSTYNAEK